MSSGFVVLMGRSSSAMVASVMPCAQLAAYEEPSPRSSVVAMLITATGIDRAPEGPPCVRVCRVRVECNNLAVIHTSERSSFTRGAFRETESQHHISQIKPLFTCGVPRATRAANPKAIISTILTSSVHFSCGGEWSNLYDGPDRNTRNKFSD